MSVAHAADTVRRVAGDASRRIATDQIVACAASALLAVRVTYKDFPVGVVLVMLLLPVALPAARRYRGAITIFAIALIAAVMGGFLTFLSAADHQIDVHRMLADCVLIAGIGVGVVTLVWARATVGIAATGLSYGVGALLSLGFTGVNHADIWKFSLSVPVVVIVLSMPAVMRSVGAQVVLLVVLAGVSAVFNSRSLAATLLIAAALLLIRRRGGRGTPGRAWRMLLQIVLIGVGGFFAVRGAILDGMLGEAVQQRTQLQIQTAGNVFAGGRPEMGASIALLRAHPWGFGTGVIPSYNDIDIAKKGMSLLGYNPQNGYVDTYMFGAGFEVHSVIGDLWLLAGACGLALGLAILVGVVAGITHSLAYGTATGIALFLGARSVWDSFFSPLLSTFFTVILCVALLLPEYAHRHADPPWLAPAPARGEPYTVPGRPLPHRHELNDGRHTRR